MTVEEKIKGRKIGIVGMARSGIAAAILADGYGGFPFVSDFQKADKLKTEISRLDSISIPYETGGHTERLLQSDYLVVSPGVPLTIDVLIEAAETGIPIFSEIEFASWVCKGKIVAVTGSNGKTTTTTLLGEIFSQAGFDTYVGGNIGLPFTEIAPRIPENGIAIIEVSNYQLETIADFKPDVAMILNLTPDHLDRHGTFENYKQAKYRINENQTSNDTIIINQDDPEIDITAFGGNATINYFTVHNNSSSTAFVKDDILYMHYAGAPQQIININEILISGPHNLQNSAAAAAVASVFEVKPETIAKVLRTFTGVEHRLETVGKVAGINFVNDSKATNVDSVCYALRSITGSIHLIAGGRDKGSGYKPILKYGRNKIKSIIAIGEAKDLIFSDLGQAFPVQFAEDMESAVKITFDAALPGETVLLSPGCASFDMYENFEQRGRVFKDAVTDLKKSKNGNETLTKK